MTDYKKSDEVSDMKVKNECFFFHNHHDLRHEANAKDSCKVVHNRNMLKAPSVTEEYGYKCPSDGDQTIQKGILKEDTQLKVKATLNCFVCEVCSKKFSAKSHITIHMRVHTKEKPYSWDICNNAFPSKSDLVKHIRVHTKEKPYMCEICKKDFSYSTSLVNHMRKPNLARHIRVHTKEKPYICETCNKAFSERSSLVRHMKNQYLVPNMRLHRKETPSICELCNNKCIELYEKRELSTTNESKWRSEKRWCHSPYIYEIFLDGQKIKIHKSAPIGFWSTCTPSRT
ncbi:zinc finger protein 267-like [Penaeus monodon]|uniref:zinc finger protein 267-like n=1 Tax=Penaeus monodon TaxID=6687 RepID=UPI0018A6DE0D|nr:zinc finger protein 267-like [Penaeus monodon]